MKYCPKCGGEFFDDVDACEDCNTGLVSAVEWNKIADERKKEDNEFFVNLKAVGDRFEADVIKDALEKENIPVLVRSFQDTSFNGLYVAQKGWGVIEVPEEYREQAKKVVEALQGNK